MARICFPSVSQFPIWEILFPLSALLFSRCKLCLRYTKGNFNENPSRRALVKILRARQASTHVIFASDSSKGQILRALSNWMRPFDTPLSQSIEHKVELKYCINRSVMFFLLLPVQHIIYLQQ